MNIKKYIPGTTLLLAFILLFASCEMLNGGKKEKGAVTAATKANVDKLLADKSNVGKRYSITGYLSYSPSFKVYVNRPQTVYVYDSANGNGNMIATIAMPWSEKNGNSVYIPDDAKDDAAIFFDNEKQPHHSGEKMMISFETSATDIYLQKIRLDPVP